MNPTEIKAYLRKRLESIDDDKTAIAMPAEWVRVLLKPAKPTKRTGGSATEDDTAAQ